MGCNYYLHMPPSNHCDHCGREDEGERLHIGKSSAGWVFALHVIPEQGIHDLPDWLARMDSGVIRNEYGEPLTRAELLPIITERRGRDDKWTRAWSGYDSEAAFHVRNCSERGPHGLLRHSVGRYCLRHGDGTWDCILGEFS
jgi:hypothetical protein